MPIQPNQIIKQTNKQHNKINIGRDKNIQYPNQNKNRYTEKDNNNIKQSTNIVEHKRESIRRMTTESRERQQQNKNKNKKQQQTILKSKGIVHNKADTNHVCRNFNQSRSPQKVGSQKDNTPQQKDIIPF